MQKRKIVIIAIIFSALIVGLGVSFSFGNTINPNCPDEIKQAIVNWDNMLDERDTNNNVVAGLVPATKEATTRIATTDYGLRTLFLTSLITLTFNTPVHFQIQLVNSLQKLFTVAKHYLRLPTSHFPLPDLVAVFTTLKRYFEKIFLILLGKVNLATTILFLLSTFLPFYLSTRLCYLFHNLRL